MNKLKLWKSQGSYKSFNTGKPMVLVMDKNTGETVLEPLIKAKLICGGCAKPIPKYEDFPGTLCITCYEKTPQSKAPYDPNAFINSIN
jgi:predicted amidophosphoribosyltransferase